jgi:hypothetical protein
MSRAVYKQQLAFGKNMLRLPKTSNVRHVHEQRGALAIWYEADLTYPEERREFHVMATGQPLPLHGSGEYNHYHGTIHLPDATVWHVYEVCSNGH